MNDEQVKRQVDQMVAFIKQEANDKAIELRTRGDEDYNMRVLSTVQASKGTIKAEYERKTREITLNQKRAQSVQANEARLEVLLARDSVLREAYADAMDALSKISEEPSEEYERLLKDLILQGLYKLRDSEVTIRCREQDLDIVSDILPAIPEMYLAAIGQPVELSLDEVNFLDKSSGGGVVLLSTGGRVSIENTFQGRLDIAYQQNMPAIRNILFHHV